jgi:O-antigen/teichoic acid export membrane protein
MANRMIGQLRAVVVSAYQALVPYVASQEENQERLRSLYRSSYRLLFYLLVPYFGLIAICQPVLLTFWLGRYESTFLQVADLCLLGWFINSLNVPSYFLFLGTGRLRWIVWSHLAIGIFCCLLGGSLGWAFGGLGVLVGSNLALAAGSHIVTIAFQRRLRVPLRELVPQGSRLLVATSVVAAVSAQWVGTGILSQGGSRALAFGVAGLAAVPTFAVTWWNVERGRLERLLGWKTG